MKELRMIEGLPLMTQSQSYELDQQQRAADIRATKQYNQETVEQEAELDKLYNTEGLEAELDGLHRGRGRTPEQYELGDVLASWTGGRIDLMEMAIELRRWETVLVGDTLRDYHRLKTTEPVEAEPTGSVYVLWFTIYMEGSTVLGVFTSKEKAEEALDSAVESPQSQGGYAELYIKELTLDDDKEVSDGNEYW